MALAPKQRRFVEEYLIDLNASQAARRAGYSPRSAHHIGQQLLAKTHIVEAIAAAELARSQRTQLTQDQVLAEIALLQHSDVAHYHIDDYGNVALAPSAPPGAMRAVASLKKKIIHTETATVYETEIRLWNKPASLRMGGEHLGLFKQQIEVSGSVKVVRLPEKAPSVEAWSHRHHAPGRRPDVGPPAEAN